ncbi:MAG: S1 RNA-binding domain-containing protein [Suipraeoptans sp.]
MADFEDHFDDANPWNLVKKYIEDGTNLHVTIDGVVNGGVIAKVEGIRGFIPASKLSLSYVENLETYLLKEIDVRVIDADQANNRLVLSAYDILRENQRKEMDKKIASIQVGSVVTGKVDSLQNYGAFVDLDGGLSGLVHISQISHNRIKLPSDVLKNGQEVTVKIIGVKDGKISLSIKALEDRPDGRQDDYVHEKVDIPKAEDIGTSLGDLFKDIKLD